MTDLLCHALFSCSILISFWSSTESHTELCFYIYFAKLWYRVLVIHVSDAASLPPSLFFFFHDTKHFLTETESLTNYILPCLILSKQYFIMHIKFTDQDLRFLWGRLLERIGKTDYFLIFNQVLTKKTISVHNYAHVWSSL